MQFIEYRLTMQGYADNKQVLSKIIYSVKFQIVGSYYYRLHLYSSV